MTTIRYNGIELKNVLTDSIDQDTVMDSTGVNPIYVRVRVTCTCLVHIANIAQTLDGTPIEEGGIPVGNLHGIALGSSTELPTGFNVIIDYLMQPRRPFYMDIGGSQLFNVIPGWERAGLLHGTPETIFQQWDVNHGPVTSVQVLQIVDSLTMRIRFSVTCHLPYVDLDASNYTQAISFRFWVADDIDGTDWTTERTYSGVLRVPNYGANVHRVMRANFKFPPLVDGFVRKRISLHQRSNGIELDFTIIDKEVWAVPPQPACHWEGSQTIGTVGPMGAMFNSTVNVRLWADRKIDKRALLALAQRILDARLHFIDMTQNKTTFLLSATWREDFTRNSVEATATIRLTDKQGFMLRAVPYQDIFGQDMTAGPYGLGKGATPGDLPYERNRMKYVPDPTAGMVGLFLSMTYPMQDPMHVSGWPAVDESLDPGKLTESKETTPPVVVEETLGPGIDHKFSPSHLQDGPYTVALITVDNDTDKGVISLPLGKASGNANDHTQILQVYRSQGRQTVRIDAERLYQWPVLPPETILEGQGIRSIPSATKITPNAPQLSADGAKSLYRVQAEYKYHVTRGMVLSAGEALAALSPFRVAGNDVVHYIPGNAFTGTDILKYQS